MDTLSAKKQCLLINKNLKCHKAERMGIRGYIVSDGDNEIRSAGTSQEAWEKTLRALKSGGEK